MRLKKVRWTASQKEQSRTLDQSYNLFYQPVLAYLKWVPSALPMGMTGVARGVLLFRFCT